jgi:hypothetical protein
MLVDTSVWIDHLRRRNEALARQLEAGAVTTHDFVVGEMSCGSMRDQSTVLALLDALPHCAIARDRDARHVLEAHKLAGTGVGWVDIHLLASAMIAGELLWSLDRPLVKAARQLGLAVEV